MGYFDSKDLVRVSAPVALNHRQGWLVEVVQKLHVELLIIFSQIAGVSLLPELGHDP